MKYCIQCIEELKLEGKSSFSNFCSDGEAINAKCDGCGQTLVDKDGRCVGECEDRHGQYPVNIPEGKYIVFTNGTYIKDNRSERIEGDKRD